MSAAAASSVAAATGGALVACRGLLDQERAGEVGRGHRDVQVAELEALGLVGELGGGDRGALVAELERGC